MERGSVGLFIKATAWAALEDFGIRVTTHAWILPL